MGACKENNDDDQSNEDRLIYHAGLSNNEDQDTTRTLGGIPQNSLNIVLCAACEWSGVVFTQQLKNKLKCH